MNILYTITWPASSSEDLPRQFYEQLRAAVAQGARFPFDCPYEVALVRATETPDATPPTSEWAVAVLAMRVTTIEAGVSEHTLPELENWFQQCVPGGPPPGSLIQHAEAFHLKLASELRSDYNVVASFGTFVGEPEPTPENTPAVVPPPPPLTPEAEALKALVAPPVLVEPPKVLPPQPPPAPPLTLPLTKPIANDSNTLSTCLGIGLMAAGVFLIPVSLLLGALMAFGQFSTDPTTGGATTTSTSDFILLLACCPVPILILGVGLIILGIFIPRWIKQNQSRPVAPVQ